MTHLLTILSAAPVQASLLLIGIGFVVALMRVPRDPTSRKYAIGFLWAFCFAVLTAWTFSLERQVLAGAHIDTESQPVPVAVKGTTRYVTSDLALLHEASWPLFLVALLAFIAAYKLARVEHEA